MGIATTLGRWYREAWIAGFAFFGFIFVLVGLFGTPKGAGIGFTIIGIGIGVILLIIAGIGYQNDKKITKVEDETEGMTSIERKAYLEEKGRLAAHKAEAKNNR